MAIKQAFQQRPEQQQVPAAQILLAACGHVVVDALDEVVIRLCHAFLRSVAGEVYLRRADDLKDAVDELVRSVLLPSFTVVLTKEINGVSVGLTGRRESIDRDGFQMPGPVDLFLNIFRRGIAGVVLQRRGLGRDMAVNNTAKAYSNMEFPLSMKRQDAFALDPTCVWPSLAEAQNYAKTNPTAYIGQVLSVVADGVATAYTIQNADGDLAPLGAAAVDIATDSEVSEMLSEVFPTDNT